jgi:23S rRNA (cytidine1920-2'-O)/16S rRNA (cytidine1409-2'-O)-methyltransferase
MSAKTGKAHKADAGRKRRLDALLVSRGLFESRSQAAASVMAGEVMVGDGRTVASKPGLAVDAGVELVLRERRRFVSRGGLKLEHALGSLPIEVEGRSCLDLGASTGGFTDCLLAAGAQRVTAVDVGYGELHWKLRNDERVTVIERHNARALEPGRLPYRPDLIVADLSFIGLAKVLPAVLRCLPPRFDLLALVKPQFEVGRERVGKGGVVRDPHDRVAALVSVGESARELGFSVQGYCESGLPGPAGNRESFIWCAECSRPGVRDIHSAAAATESDLRSGAPTQ